jgi:hypothetical protein
MHRDWKTKAAQERIHRSLAQSAAIQLQRRLSPDGTTWNRSKREKQRFIDDAVPMDLNFYIFSLRVTKIKRQSERMLMILNRENFKRVTPMLIHFYGAYSMNDEATIEIGCETMRRGRGNMLWRFVTFKESFVNFPD